MADKKRDEYIHFRCKACGKKLRIKTTYEGGNIVSCPRCHSPLTLPLANLQALVSEGPDIGSATTGSKLDLEILMSRLREGHEPAPAETPSSEDDRHWSPGAGLSRARELDSLHAMLSRQNNELIERLQKLFRQPNLTQETVSHEMERITAEREEQVRRHVSVHVTELKGKIARLESEQAAATEHGRRRLEQLRKSVLALRTYARFVLGKEV
jgi:hypothetical protein